MKTIRYSVFALAALVCFATGCEQVSQPADYAVQSEQSKQERLAATREAHHQWVLANSQADEERAVNRARQKFFNHVSPYLRSEKVVDAESLTHIHETVQQIVSELKGRPAKVAVEQLIGHAMLTWVMPLSRDEVPTELVLAYVDMLTRSVSIQFDDIATALEGIEGHQREVRALAEANLINLQAHVDLREELEKEATQHIGRERLAKEHPHGLPFADLNVEAIHARFQALAK
ncbi:MAG: hypothetical protein ACE5G0_04020 [Rhodothermales bacterium]